MTTMYALRLANSKMFIRAIDGNFTDNKVAAQLCSTVDEAREYVKAWRAACVSDASGYKIYIVEVTTKSVAQRIGREVEAV